MPFFQQKSSALEAEQFHPESDESAINGFKGFMAMGCFFVYRGNEIVLPETEKPVSAGDWIAKNAEGRYFSIDAASFGEMFEPAISR